MPDALTEEMSSTAAATAYVAEKQDKQIDQICHDDRIRFCGSFDVVLK